MNATDVNLYLVGFMGTGKSTVALYRVRAMIEGLRKAGLPE